MWAGDSENDAERHPDPAPRLWFTVAERGLSNLGAGDVVVILASDVGHDLVGGLIEIHPDLRFGLIARHGCEGAWPEGMHATVHGVERVNDIHVVLGQLPPVAFVIDLAPDWCVDSVARFRTVFPYLSDGGAYLTLYDDNLLEPAGGLPAYLRRVVDDSAVGKKPASPGEARLRRAIGEVALEPNVVLALKRGTHWLKVPEDTPVGAVARNRSGNWLVAEQTLEGGHMFDVMSGRWVNRPEFRDRFRTHYRQPARRLRRYARVVVEPQQVVYAPGVFLPETFRLYRQASVHHKGIADLGPRLAAPGKRRVSGEVAPLDGTFFYLDTEHPGTYGHVLTEVASRLWAWDDAASEYPECRALVSPPRGQSTPEPWFIDILGGYGIPPSRVEVLPERRRVERLISATPLFSNPVVAHPALHPVWDRLTNGLVRHASAAVSARRLFVGRKADLRRACRNADEVYEFFEGWGFQVVFPEDLPLPDQAALFRSATCVAGFGGSAMINTVFCADRVPRIVLNAEGYNAMNEFMIASVQDSDVYYFYCPADVPPGHSWSEKAFMSDFVFDFDRDGMALTRILDNLDRQGWVHRLARSARQLVRPLARRGGDE
jgi:capsular polysaccharide biosynthesis protein